MSLALLQRAHVFPVRHHSPRSSAVLRALLAEVRPRAVLVEGPSDAGALVDALVDPETRPPVAILGYRSDGTPASSVWPFATYSPEYVALAWAKTNGARVELIDIPIGVTLGHRDEEMQSEDEDGDKDGDEDEEEEEEEDLHEACARALGHRSFNELWEAAFEAPRYDVGQFRAAVLAYADLVRARGDRALHRARDAYMTRRAGEVLTEAGIAPEQAVVVVGAAHAAAFLAGDVDPALEATLPEAVPSTATLIPYSFPRLAEQLGYGAGNRAPQYYQRAHDAGCDFRRATLEVLIEFAEHLRLRGFAASLADTIEAYRLAAMLADIRGKAAPGLDEVREATIATMCHGERRPVDTFLWPAVIGRSVGKVAGRVAKNSLQEEFWREVKARRLPDSDEPEQFALRLNNELEVGSSVFLHRLRVAGIPYASFHGTQRLGAGKGATGKGTAEEAGGYAALSRARESWEAQWTPATDIGLVEKIVLGDSLERVAARVLRERLDGAASAGAAADVLLESVVVACPEITSLALRACDVLASTDDDLPSLARACRALSGLAAYGSSRSAAAAASEQAGEQAIVALTTKTFDRAVLRVPGACVGADDAVRDVKDALRTLHEIALAQPVVDKAAWLEAAHGLSGSYAVNPSCAGLAAGLLYLGQALGEEEVALLVGQRLSNGLEPGAAAAFLEGFLEVNALVLVKNRAVVQALDAFLCAIEAGRFKEVLPVLRRALGPLGQTERRYLLENIVALRGLGDKARAAQAIVNEKDAEKLKQASEELSKAMDDLDDLL
jgi:hypothetical protein